MCRIWLEVVSSLDSYRFPLHVANLVCISALQQRAAIYDLYYPGSIQMFRFLATFSPWSRGLEMNNLRRVTGTAWVKHKPNQMFFSTLSRTGPSQIQILHDPSQTSTPFETRRAHTRVCHNDSTSFSYCCYLLIRVFTQAWFCSLLHRFWPRAQHRSADQWGAMYQNDK